MTARSSGIAVFCRSDKRHASDTMLVLMRCIMNSLVECLCFIFWKTTSLTLTSSFGIQRFDGLLLLWVKCSIRFYFCSKTHLYNTTGNTICLETLYCNNPHCLITFNYDTWNRKLINVVLIDTAQLTSRQSSKWVIWNNCELRERLI